MRELGIVPDRVNVKGGGTTIAHPRGLAGCGLVGTLACIHNEENARYGCATARCGGDQGKSTIIEREEY